MEGSDTSDTVLGSNGSNDNASSSSAGMSGSQLAELQVDLRDMTREINELKAANSSGLELFFLSTAERMLTDYIKDLKKSNIYVSVQRKIEEYEAFLQELQEAAKQRQPESTVLTPPERHKLISMLLDYQAVLTRELDLTQSSPVESDLEPRVMEVDTELRIRIEDGSGISDVPVYISDTAFLEGGYKESLSATLDLCEKQFLEVVNMLPLVVIFIHQCTYLVKTLSPAVEINIEKYRTILGRLNDNIQVDMEGDPLPSNLRNSVSFCFESLVGLARRFQLVADLLKKCSSRTAWCKSALELADARPSRQRRWSEFSLAIRNCEWSLDLVELAFHALEKLLTEGTYTVKDASFKWSEDNCRMVLQIPGKLERQNNSFGNSLLEVSRGLEEKDLTALIAQLDELVESQNSKEKKPLMNLSDSNAPGIANFLRKLLMGPFYMLNLISLSDADAHRIAKFLSEKLRGPTPGIVPFPPYSFSFGADDSKNLKYVEYLDKGSSGMVAIHEWYGMRVAVKSVRNLGMSRKTFEEEAAILAMVQHPNVVRLIGCGFLEHIHTGQLVMELMDHDLRAIIDARLQVLPEPGSSPFSPMVAIDLMLQIAQAMLYLWQHRVVHRDLKAKNVLVNICKPLRTSSDSANTTLMGLPVSAVLPHTQENYVAKLADFGLAKCRPQTSYVATLMAGTTGWRAPEVFNVPEHLAHKYKWPADVYSFAMTCYEIVTGKLPFEGEPNLSLHAKVMDGVRPSFGNLRADFPDAVKELIQQCWATRPEDRPNFDYIVKRLWECKVLTILPRFERKIMQTSGVAGSSPLRQDLSIPWAPNTVTSGTVPPLQLSLAV